MSKRLSVLLTLLLLTALFFPPVTRGNTRNISIPLSVRLVLSRLSPFLDRQNYKEGARLLLNFQKRCEPSNEKTLQSQTECYHPEITFALGNCFLLQQQFDKAITAYNQTVKRDPGHTSAWLNLARAFYETRNYDNAALCFLRGYETAEKKDPQLLYYTGACHLMAGMEKKALKIFERLFASHPTAIIPQWKEYMVHALLATNQPLRALPFIRELAGEYTGSKQISWQEILLYQYLQLNMEKKALVLARRLADQAPTISNWWKALTHIHLNRGDYSKALTTLTIYSFLEPLNDDEKKLFADLNMQLGIPLRTLAIYENYLQNKMDKRLLLKLVSAYNRLGTTQKALECLNTVSLGKKDIALLRLKAELLYIHRQFSQAAKIYEKIAGFDQKHAGSSLLMAGYATWQAGNPQTAEKLFRKAAASKEQKIQALTAISQLSLPVSSKP
jgi:tetratricopeptide (TPR) repeat protein